MQETYEDPETQILHSKSLWSGYVYYNSGDEDTPSGVHRVGEDIIWKDANNENQIGYIEYNQQGPSAILRPVLESLW